MGQNIRVQHQHYTRHQSTLLSSFQNIYNSNSSFLVFHLSTTDTNREKGINAHTCTHVKRGFVFTIDLFVSGDNVFASLRDQAGFFQDYEDPSEPPGPPGPPGPSGPHGPTRLSLRNAVQNHAFSIISSSNL